MPISTMKKMTVLAHGNDADAIVRKLMDLKCVQIRQIPADEGGILPERMESDGTRLRTEAKLADIRAALPLLSKYTSRKSTIGRRVHRVNRKKFVADGKADYAWQTVQRTLEVQSRLKEIENERAAGEALMQALLPWLDYDAPLCECNTEKTLLQLGSCPASVDPEQVRAELDETGAYAELVSGDRNAWYFAVTCHKDDVDEVEHVLVARGFVKVSFADIATTAQHKYSALEAEVVKLADEETRAIERLQDLADCLDEVEILADIEQTTLQVCLQKQKLFRTQNCVVLDGFVPEVRVDDVAHALSVFDCAFEVSDPEEGEDVPVLLKNNPFSSTFEWVIEMYSYPKYGTFDPTLVMSIFYFLIFGLMFADVGYGLLLTLACFGGVKLLNPREGLKRMMYMFGYCGISCMFMGVLFGGWFGNLPTAIMNSFFPAFEGQAELTPIGNFFNNGLLFNPVNSSIAFLFLSLAVGEVHLIAGMVLDMLKTWKSDGPVVALCSNVPYWVLFAGIDMMAPSVAAGMISTEPLDAGTQALFTTLSDVGFFVVIAGLAMILFLKGVGQKTFFGWLIKGLGGLYSLISFASDLLSYSRILALGLVASVIAQVINMLTGLGTSGPVGFFFMLLVMILGHGLNLAINLLGTFVHAARLQYIEFFGKFYEDGGEAFKPALPSEEFSEDVPNVPNVNQ